MFQLNFRGNLPIYEQLAKHITTLICSKVLQPNAPLPSVRTIAHDNAINPNTVQKAYMLLEQQGLIYSIQSKGSFVADSVSANDAVIAKVISDFSVIAQDALRLGVSPEQLHLSIDQISYKGENT